MNQKKIKPPIRDLIDRNGKLNLANYGLSEIPEDIYKLNNLKILDLSSDYVSLKPNRIENIPDKFSNLTSLEELYLNLCGLKNFPLPILKLVNLKKLSLLNANINQPGSFKIPNEIFHLEKLDYLNLGGLHLNFLPPGISRLSKLRELELHENRLSDLPENFHLLRNNLKTLNLSWNHFEKFPEVITQLEQLESLDFTSNHIIEIPASFLKLNRLSKFEIANNNLVSPPVEIGARGLDSIINFLKEINRQGEDFIYEAKLLIIGQPRAGKTSFRYKLFDSTSELAKEDETTRGIDIAQANFNITDKEGNLRKFFYNVWDFGGQQIYQATHQFFLTNRSLYVLIMDTGKDSLGNDDSTINYWLQAVELLGGSNPLLLVLNEKNERQINIDLSQKKSRFHFLKESYSVDLNALIPSTKNFSEKRLKDFKELKEDIETELKRLPLVGYPMPKNWAKIREELKVLAQQYPYIYRATFIEICNRFDVTEFDKQMELSSIFHDLGVYLHFRETALEDIIILQNVWATEAVFAVLENEKVKANKGKFNNSDFAEIWKNKKYETEIHNKLLELMKRFELCYEVDNDEPMFIAPEMLDDSIPKGCHWQPGDDLPLYYSYDFMPRGLITRLIVRLNRFIKFNKNQQVVWKTGMHIDGNLLDCKDTIAEISEAWDNRQLSIRIQGNSSKKLMNIITFAIDSLHNEFLKKFRSDWQNKKRRWSKMIPCNCLTCTNTLDTHFYDYEELIERKEFGKVTIECKNKPFETVQIESLIDGVFAKKEAEPLFKKRKIFISYAHEDEKWKNDLVNHLSPLVHQEFITCWDDKQIKAGIWNQQIERELDTTDIFLLLITSRFLASEYITSKEIITAYTNFKANKSEIIPIICESCDWELLPITYKEKEIHPEEKKEMYLWLGKFQAFPTKANPIQNWEKESDGFKDVVEQLRRHILQ